MIIKLIARHKRNKIITTLHGKGPLVNLFWENYSLSLATRCFEWRGRRIIKGSSCRHCTDVTDDALKTVAANATLSTVFLRVGEMHFNQVG